MDEAELVDKDREELFKLLWSRRKAFDTEAFPIASKHQLTLSLTQSNTNQLENTRGGSTSMSYDARIAGLAR